MRRPDFAATPVKRAAQELAIDPRKTPLVVSAALDNPSLSSFDPPLLEPVVQQHSTFFALVGMIVALAATSVEAQRIRLQRSPALESNDRRTASRDGLVPVTPRGANSTLTDIRPSTTPASPTTASPVRTQPASPPLFTSASNATLGAPEFDPYSPNQGAASVQPQLFGNQTSPALNGGTTPYWESPGGATYSTPGFGTTTPIPQQPPMLFPNGSPALFPNGLGFGTVGGWPQAEPGPYMRLFQDVRFTYTWVAGSDGPRELQTNDVELATTVNFPNFMYSGQPLRVSPGFIFHFWDGPDTTPGSFPTTMPSRVYSAYVGGHWQPMLTPMFGGDIDVSVGVYSDFGKLSSDSVRVQGTGVFVLALTPTLAVKGGINYLDRVDVKLLPAGGLLWTPNPQTRFDIFFPKPKLAQYLTTIGNTDVWWYLNGEYGGGSWTVGRTPLVTDDRRVDINDIRLGGGIEWTSYTGVRGFVEAAYVFERELVFASGSGPAPVSLKDSVMVRGGLSY